MSADPLAPVPAAVLPAEPPAAPARGLKAFLGRHQRAIVVVGSILTAGIIVALLWGRRDEFATAIREVSLPILLLTTALQTLGLVSRSESWHHAVRAAGATVSRRILFRASAMQVLGSVINGQLGVAMRIAALRRSSPEVTPKIPTLVAAEFPIVAVELAFAAVASFTLVGPLGIPWWTPIVAFVLAGGVAYGMRHLSRRPGRDFWAGLKVLEHPRDATLLTLALMVAILCQILRNWMLLHAVGVDASFWDATAVLIAVATLAQLPTGPAAGAAAALLILGDQGAAAAAAAGVLMTATGVMGGAMFAAWSGTDQLLAYRAAGRATAGRPATRRNRRDD
ncbi:lysylphosphatidylglycerol synthase domain-containing protein [Patulibacter americanus]|uniref:lysylphosphatidylglycerol synthase domain-containing protein n=1 Tax=Patulibacter americanus TaxID=588672 RepID=UPI0003B56AAE|nr:lysylphosphatidylglycerol synthase domain-containing protein [Patulibacter americanus]